jgi:hypothetical protein
VLGFWPCDAKDEPHGKLLLQLDKLVAHQRQQQQQQAGGGAAAAGEPVAGPPDVVLYNDAHLLAAHLQDHPEDCPPGWENTK